MDLAASHRPSVTDLRLPGAELSLAASLHACATMPGQAPAILYAHGFGQTRRAWSATAGILAAHGYAGLAFDARGHGASDRNKGDDPYTGHQFTDDTIVLAGEMARPPVLVAASMGGLFGLLAESRWPGLFRAMVLVDITPRWESAGLERILGFMTAFPDLQVLMDEAVEQELIDQIEAVLLRHSQAHGGAVRFDSLASRRAGARSYVQLHMHAPAEWTLGRAAQARQALESELMDTVPGLHATIELLPQGLATAFEQSEAQEKTA